MKCGGMKKSGGTTSAVKKIKMKTGGFAAGIPYKIGAGSTDGGSSPTGMMKRGGAKKYGEGGPTDPNRYVMNKTNVFGNSKFKEISKNKFDRVSNRYSNQKGSESFGDNKSINQQVISGKNKKNYVSRVDEVRRAESNKNLMPPKPGGVKKPVLKKAMYGTTMMKKGGDPGDGKPNSVLKNLGIFGGAGALIGAFTTEEGIARRAARAEARYEKRKLKKALPKYPAIKEGLQENVQDSKSKYGGRVKKK
jgi:hypothetical protein